MNITLNNSWNLKTNTCTSQLKGIFTRNVGELPSQTKYLIAVDHYDNVVAHVAYEVIGNQYIYAKKEFGDQLEKQVNDRMGY